MLFPVWGGAFDVGEQEGDRSRRERRAGGQVTPSGEWLGHVPGCLVTLC